MKLLRIRARHFGPLHDVDTGEDTELSSLVAVLGPNEAGKSSLHQAVVSLFYGFYPATRDAHPLAPWSGESPELRAWLRTERDEVLEVHRRLLSRPDGSLLQGERVEDLRNRQLSLVETLDQKVFAQVYAITLADLAGLREEGWQAVQDRLVVGLGASDMRPPREAAEELEARADSLWRPTRRGTPRHKVLREELDQLQTRRREARERDRELRRLHRRIAEAEERLASLREQQARVDERRARVARLQPVHRRLRQIERLEAIAGPLHELEPLPGEIQKALAELDERLEEEDERRRRLRDDLQELEARAEGPGEEFDALLERRAELQALADRAPLLQERSSSRGRWEVELERLERRRRATAAPLFDPDAEAPGPDALEPVPMGKVRRDLDDAHRLESEARKAGDELSALRSQSPPPPAESRAPASWIALAAGVLLLGVGFWAAAAEAASPLVAGGSAVAGAVILLAGAWNAARRRARAEWTAGASERRKKEEDRLEGRIRELGQQAAERRERAAELLGHLPLRPEVLAEAGGELVGELERLLELGLDLEERRKLLEDAEQEDRKVETALAAARRELAALEDLPAERVAALAELGRRLEEAARMRDAAKEAARQASRVTAELERVEGRHGELQARRQKMTEQILTAGGVAELEPALERVEERLRARDRLKMEREQLEREENDPEAARSEVEAARRRGEEWLDDPQALDRLDRERKRLDEESDAVREELQDLRLEAASIDGESADLVEGRIRSVREEMRRVARERDRLFVLARLIRTAERRFRDEHQPDLLKRAGEYLDRITGGRYRRLLLAEASAGKAFALEAEHLPGALPVASPISTGTREQVYLALRLAIVDHLDRGRDPLPLFLDEVLVNWDPDRREEGLDLLARVSETRQVFFFTCHPELASSVHRRGGSIVRLPTPSADGTS